ncbi:MULTISPECIES: hypothetical protein [unclassified Bradyrhizobium]|uniref:hypothetical protein n=1 Tax=unclassified Bradyrhizobium TaxID=2631580 RepID=UPI002FF11B00
MSKGIRVPTSTSTDASRTRPSLDKQDGFVLEVAGTPVLVFSATSARSAEKFRKQKWLAEELGAYASGGRPVWDGKAALTVRRANLSESAELEIGRKWAEAEDGDTKYVFAFLVPVDPLQN